MKIETENLVILFELELYDKQTILPVQPTGDQLKKIEKMLYNIFWPSYTNRNIYNLAIKYLSATDPTEKQRLKDEAYEQGIMLGESWSETVELNNIKS
jgi:hypothetical protein